MYTGWKSREGGTWCFLPKSQGGVKAFRKNCLVGSPYFGFFCISINKCLEICLRRVVYLPSPPHLTPLCASVNKSHCFSLCLCLTISFSLFISLPVYLSICQYVYLSICLSVYLSICQFVYLSICPNVHLSSCLSVYLSAYLSLCLSLCLLSIYLYICISVFLSICQSA
jgi:hypothetical protein